LFSQVYSAIKSHITSGNAIIAVCDNTKNQNSSYTNNKVVYISCLLHLNIAGFADNQRQYILS